MWRPAGAGRWRYGAKGKNWQGARVRKTYDIARTPCQRLLASKVLTEDKKAELANIYAALNPAGLLWQIHQAVQHLVTLAEREQDA